MRIFCNWLWVLVKRYVKSGCLFQSAYLAYLTLLTLVPLLTLSVILLTHVSVFTPMVDDLQRWLLKALLVNVADQVIQTVHLWVAQAAALSWKHMLFFFVMALVIMFNMNRIFRDIWHTEKSLSWSVHFIVYALVLFCSPLLLGLMFIMSGVFSQFDSLSAWLASYHLDKPMLMVVSDGILFVWLTLMNWTLPLCRVPLRAALLSGAVTTVLLLVSKKIYALLMLHSSYEMLYGALSAVPLFLVWLYVAWCIILFGAVLGNEYAKRYHPPRMVS